MTGATLTYSGDKSIFQVLARLQSPDDRKSLLDAIGARGVSSTQQRFLDEKTPEGTPWLKSLRARLSGGKTLRDTARLFQSFTHQATASSVEWGTNVVYAGIHQFGGDIRAKNKPALAFRLADGSSVVTKKVTMPARPFLGVNAQDEEGFDEVAGIWLKGLQA